MQHNDGAEPGTRAGPSANTGRSDAEWLGVARLGLAPGQTDDSSLWDQVDLTDPEDRRFGDFELLERIGRGGMGVVFRAFQHSLGREVAIKFIVGALVDHPAAVSTFFAEARAAARLHHPHIVPVFESGQIDGQPYFSMPLLGGETLAQRIQKGRFDPKAAVDLLLTLCAAVSYAHELGLLHLDLKPGNVLFDDGGRALISDFGLA
ncbi:MAG: serine/threonine-protein kinase, partial [Pseudomonadota bacterium]|nr:serine/threonine-protein kinase [Pseudomonadota bacterium]